MTVCDPDVGKEESAPLSQRCGIFYPTRDILGKFLSPREVALGSGFEKLQSDLGVTYQETGAIGPPNLQYCELQLHFLPHQGHLIKISFPLGGSPGKWL